MKDGRSLREKLARSADIPADAAAGVPRVEIIGRSELVVNGHNGILEYTPERIRIDGRLFRLTVKGAELCITAMDAGSIGITGTIASVELFD